MPHQQSRRKSRRIQRLPAMYPVLEKVPQSPKKAWTIKKARSPPRHKVMGIRRSNQLIRHY